MFLLIPWQLCFALVNVYIREYSPRGSECKTKHATYARNKGLRVQLLWGWRVPFGPEIGGDDRLKRWSDTIPTNYQTTIRVAPWSSAFDLTYEPLCLRVKVTRGTICLHNASVLRNIMAVILSNLTFEEQK